MRTFCIYRAVLNGKSYIGKTTNFERRKYTHIHGNGNHSLFHKAIKEYGSDCVSWEVLETTDSAEKAKELEKKYIKQFHSLHPNGYNVAVGGQGTGTSYCAKAVVSFDLNGKYLKRYDSAVDVEIEDGNNAGDVGLCCKGKAKRSGDKLFMYESDYLKYGPPKPYEKPEPYMRAIVQCDLNGNLIAEFKSLNEASVKTGTSRTSISGVLSRIYKQANGFIWAYKENFPIKDVASHQHNKKGIKVAQVDKDTGKIINVYDRIADAGRALGVNYKCIHKALDKPKATAYGFRWISQ